MIKVIEPEKWRLLLEKAKTDPKLKEKIKIIAQQEKWYRGDLSWKLHSAQKLISQKFSETQGKLFVVNLSRQMGKTFWSVTKAVEQAIKKPKSQIRYGAAFHTDLYEFIIPAFEKCLEDAPPEVKGKYKSHGSAIVFPNDSRIKLVGLDRSPDGLRGNTLDLVIIDECGFVSNLDYLYKSVIIPATTHRPNAKVILASTPPSTPAHSFVDYCHKAERENAYIKLTIDDNPLLTEDVKNQLINELGGINSTTVRRELYCEFVTDSDLAIIPEWKDEYVKAIERDEFYQYYHRYVGMDLGVKDFTACLFGYYDFKRGALIIEDEFQMNGPSMNTELLVNAIKSKEAEIWGDHKVYRRISDNNWPILMQDLASIHNLSFIGTTKDNLEAMINEVRLMVQKGQILINPRCVGIIGCLKYGVWNAKKTEFARSSVYGHFDHLAALIYLVRNLAKHTNPIPATHGHTPDKSFLLNISNETHNQKTLTRALIPQRAKLNLDRI